ncbi:P-loop containing nucleoside triphosphate hydrolase protein [Morchella snyderi]|nr:P-loop containing nucleoside triphosphate hydrolase protein [Morchella snyderi]
MQQQQNASRFATQSPVSSWRASSRPGVLPAPVRPASNFYAPPGEEAWTQYDGLGPVGNGRDLDRSWRNPAGRGGNNNRDNRSTHNSLFQPQGSKSSGHNSRGPVQRNNRGGFKSQGRERSPPRGAGRGGDRMHNEWPQSKSSGHMKSRDVRPRELVDEAYLEKNFEALKEDDYKKAPKALFNNPKAFLWDFKTLSPKSAFLAHKGGLYRCTVIVTLPNGQKIEAVGDHSHKKNSEKIACQHCVLKLHSNGLLKDIIYQGSHEAAFDQALLNDESDAKMDIYDYCARFDAVPMFIFRETQRPGNRRPLVECTVEMPEQNIQASARAADKKVAEILACVEFKKQAEEYHAKHGESTIVVKDLLALSTRNARKFFEFYKMHNRGVTYDCTIKQVSGGTKRLKAGYFLGQMMLNNEPLGDPVEMHSKKAADTAAYLTGAVELKKREPGIFPKFLEALRLGNGELLKPITPAWIHTENDSVNAMTDTLMSVRRVGLPPSEEEEDMMEAKGENGRRMNPWRRLDKAFVAVKNIKLQEDYEKYLSDPALTTLRQKREELPMNQYQGKVLDIVENHPVSIIVGATGSGKTTQVPQILLEKAIKEGRGAECNIICTQPRRIAATSVAQRVAVERNESLQKSIGYHVRFDSKLPSAGGSITYCTTGILLQQLRNSADEALEGVTHLVIDEVHERDILIDFLLIILKRVLKERKILGKPSVKVVLMSATMDTDLFSNYFAEKNEHNQLVPCPDLSVPGRTFPVKELYLEDIRGLLKESHSPADLFMLNEPDSREYLGIEGNLSASAPVSRLASRVPSRAPSRAASTREEAPEDDDAVDNSTTINWKQEVKLGVDGQAVVSNEKQDAIVPIGLIATTIAHIAKTTTEGAMLVFLPGLEEITGLDEALRIRKPLGVDFSDANKFKLCLLHSSIPNQNEVFDDVPEGCRKVILSTNIAETSITIPDVRYVIDSGKMREKQYEQARRITQLVCTWISKSNSKQRAGRAGRVQNGNYWALFSRNRFESMRATGLPEMLRSDLQEICLDIKAQGFTDPVKQFLSEAIEAPTPNVIDASLNQLMTLGALTDNERLTPLGRVLATMPVEPALGKMILLAVIFRCLDPIIILGASTAARDLFVSPPEKRQDANRAKHAFVRGTGSDHMAMVNAFREWRWIRDQNGQYAASRFADDNFLHKGALRTLEQTAEQIEEILVQASIIPFTRKGQRYQSEIGHARLNDNSNCVPLIKALTLAGMYPNLGINTGGRGFRTANENFTMIHPTSVHYVNRTDDQLPFGTLVTYSAKARSNDGSTLLLRTVTESSPLAAMLFGGKLTNYGNNLEIDSWLPFLAPTQTAKITHDFRRLLDRLLAHAFRSLSKRGNDRSGFLADDPARETFAKGLVEVCS